MDCACRMFHAIGVDCHCIPPCVVLIAFTAWLTTRDEVTTLSSRHDVTHIVNLVTEFCESQGWQPPKDDKWFGRHFKNIKAYPKD